MFAFVFPGLPWETSTNANDIFNMLLSLRHRFGCATLPNCKYEKMSTLINISIEAVNAPAHTDANDSPWNAERGYFSSPSITV